MSQITDEIMSRKAVLKAEEDAKVAKLELNKTLLKGLVDPLNAILNELKEEGWSATNPRDTLQMSSPSTHLQETWQGLMTGDRKTFDAHFHTGKDGLVVKLDGKLIAQDALREKLLDHVAKHYTKKEANKAAINSSQT